MWNEPSLDELARLPELYSTEGTPARDKIIHEHFFLGGSDWYVAEYGSADRLFFGYAILNSDFDNAEWGYIGFDELRGVRTRLGIEVDRDLHWKPCRAVSVKNIRESGGV